MGKSFSSTQRREAGGQRGQAGGQHGGGAQKTAPAHPVGRRRGVLIASVRGWHVSGSASGSAIAAGDRMQQDAGRARVCARGICGECGLWQLTQILRWIGAGCAVPIAAGAPVRAGLPVAVGRAVATAAQAAGCPRISIRGRRGSGAIARFVSSWQLKQLLLRPCVPWPMTMSACSLGTMRLWLVSKRSGGGLPFSWQA